MSYDLKFIRNFSIIAHIDHGKSTLADRLLEYTGTVPAPKMREQVLDQMELERERGITIKAKAVRLRYESQDRTDYTLNLIDTPGHVDFTYEVSRALTACEGVLLVVDASQGVEAQTLANLYLALDHGLTVVPVINKIDLASADVARVTEQIGDLLLIDASGIILSSAKEGIGTQEILEAIVTRVSPPQGDPEAPLKALVFDSWFDPFQGVIAYVRVVDGMVRPGLRICLFWSGATFDVSQVGVFSPEMRPVPILRAGEVGYLMAGMKDVHQVRVGDTITEADRPTQASLPGFREVRPVVFAGLYPAEGGDYLRLKEALEKLRLNDSAFTFEPETSAALGFGFRCGFLGRLHMEIVQERLEREFDVDLLTTAPTVVYRVRLTDGTQVEVDNPSRLPSRERILSIEEPYIGAVILAPVEYVGPVVTLCQEKRGVQAGLEYLQDRRVLIRYDLPLAEVILDFYDRLKSLTRGYASLDYELKDYREGDLVKLDIMINGEPVDALSAIVHRDQAYSRGRQLTGKLKGLIARQLFEVVLQAAMGGKVIARESIPPLRKQVTAKCYGGDVTRKRKLLERQKEGKRRMKRVGRVEIPQEAFMAVLRIRESGDSGAGK
ncbi:MAG: translation elongation factor 4 [Candidatus Methylomirabilales bacterium]